MKSETTPTSTPAPSTTAWPIDPALQQQSQPATTTAASTNVPTAAQAQASNSYAQYAAQYAAYHAQNGYPAHYTYIPPQPIQPMPQQARPVATTSTATTAQANASAVDSADVSTLNDALGSAGVDLRAEEESLQKSQDYHTPYRAYEDRSRRQPATPSFNTAQLGISMRTLGATRHKVAKVPEDSINYLALALRARLQDLVTDMIAAAKHRTDTQFDRPASFYEDVDGVSNGTDEDGESSKTPMWGLIVRKDVMKQLAAIEKVEREEEMRVRRLRVEQAAAVAAQQADALTSDANNGGGGGDNGTGDSYDDSEGGPKKKRKKEGPGVAAKNMSEDVRKQMSNLVANQASGVGKKYAWMTAANASVAPRASKPEPASAPSPAPVTSPVAPSATPAAVKTSTWGRPYTSTLAKPTPTPSDTAVRAPEDTRTIITLRDAMFVIEKERGHGGGKGSALGWT